MLKEIKYRMAKKLAFEIVKRHIDHWDPIGLLELGVPDDEYDVEIMMIVEKLSAVLNVKQLSEVILLIFNEMFYEGEGTFPKEECDEVAASILEEIVHLERRMEMGRMKSGARRKSKT